MMPKRQPDIRRDSVVVTLWTAQPWDIIRATSFSYALRFLNWREVIWGFLVVNGSAFLARLRRPARAWARADSTLGRERVLRGSVNFSHSRHTLSSLDSGVLGVTRQNGDGFGH